MAKRAIDFFTSPLSALKDPKKAKKGDKESEVVLSMDREEDSGVGEGGGKKVTEKLLKKVNDSVTDALSMFTPSDDSPETVMMLKMVPMLATVISMAVGEVVREEVREMEARITSTSKSVREERLMSAVRTLTWENDRLQQYSRRESVRIWGLPQNAHESKEEVEDTVLKVFNDCGADVKLDDIAVAHRTGKQSTRGPRPVLVKFVSRRKRNEVMTKKKELRGKKGYEKTFINDDLTPLRSRLLGYVKRIDGVEKAWTVDGRIFVAKKVPLGLRPELRPKPTVIESPDDLFRLGVDRVDYKELGLAHLAESDDVQE